MPHHVAGPSLGSRGIGAVPATKGGWKETALPCSTHGWREVEGLGASAGGSAAAGTFGAEAWLLDTGGNRLLLLVLP